ncbi:MAG TPA: alanine--tRNA ligase, partial [Armatimonadetes bacterium]|nr:alanine--tRNA ligase [Armatimonadota bacterium]
MLGNFSFGDYFKKEAIEWAWEFFMDVLKLPRERLWVSIYEDDDEAFEVWHKHIGLPEERIVRLGKSDNWWGPVGDEGPCGPCTEIHYDRGAEYGCGQPDCKPGCDCDRWGELWNLVFQQYDQQRDGTLKPLPKPGIDTGMGLERLAAVMQDKDTVFETDLFWEALEHILHLIPDKSYRYGTDRDMDAAVRIIADHARAAVFLITDGVVPSNEGRGYVLRRFIRRACRFGRRLGLTGAFLHTLTHVYAELMQEPYPEIKQHADITDEIIRREEERFAQTIDRGLELLREIIERQEALGESIIPGEDAFTLYDTYGFPLELTQEIASEHGFTVDVDGFHTAMERQRELARMRSAFHIEGAEEFEGVPATEFVGYETTQATATVIAIRRMDGDLWVALDRTPFYAEAGGQIADTGWLRDEAGQIEIEVLDAQWRGDVIAHRVNIKRGVLSEGMTVHAIVDEHRRNAIRRAHTATHLLHAALRRVLGPHARQSGSLVAPDRLRFDFSHPQPLTPDEIVHVENIVHELILNDIPVEAFETALEKARAMGAIALFGEKYGDVVRVVKIEDVSMELCGGTHLDHTAQVGTFKIIAETGVAANVRRIEALTGFEALKWLQGQLNALHQAAELLNASPDKLSAAIESLLKERRALEQRVEQLEARAATQQIEALVERAITIDNIRLVTAQLSGLSTSALGQLADAVVARLPASVVVLSSIGDDKVLFVAKVSPEAQACGAHAGNLVREVARVVGGGGGGRPDFAQAGGKDVSKVTQALSKAAEVLRKQIRR